MSAWTTQEDDLLRRNRSLSNEDVAGKLAERGYLRSAKSVTERRRRLSLGSGAAPGKPRLPPPQNPPNTPDPLPFSHEDGDARFLKALFRALANGQVA